MNGNPNKTVVEQFFRDVMNRGNPAAGAQLVAPDFIVHHPMLPGGQGDWAAVMQMMQQFWDGFPDLHYTVEDEIAEGDRVATRWTATGTQTHPFQGIDATGKAVRVGGTDIFRVANGRVAEAWVCSDMLGLFLQLGQFPPHH